MEHDESRGESQTQLKGAWQHQATKLLAPVLRLSSLAFYLWPCPHLRHLDCSSLALYGAKAKRFPFVSPTYSTPLEIDAPP
jgi:hypothetical protein